MRNICNKRVDLVAEALGQMRVTTSILTYNDKNSLSCVVVLAYYSTQRNTFMHKKRVQINESGMDDVKRSICDYAHGQKNGGN